MKNWKRVTACLLSAGMVCVLSACGNGETSSTTAAAGTTQAATTKAAETTAAAAAQTTTAAPETTAAVEYPDYVTEPITIEMWHVNASGANADYINQAIEEFNATNTYGITVEGSYQGAYNDLLAKVTTGIAAGETPEIVILAAEGMPTMAEKNVLADMSAYVARDGFDMSNFAGGMTDISYYDGQIVAFPYARSTALFFYNKDIWDELGFEAPTSFEELLTMAKAVTEKHPDVYGFGLQFSPFYLQEPIIRSLGADGMITADGTQAAALDDGSLLKFLTDWRQGVDEGYIVPPAVTAAESTLKDMLYKGQLASAIWSCGGLANIIKYSNEAGMTLGVSYFPVYGGYGSEGGGGNLGIVGRDKTQQEIAAAWEFVKFLTSDEQAATRAANTGFLPITKSCTETEIIKKLWEEKPQYKVAYEQLQYCGNVNWSKYVNEWNTYLTQAMSYVIQDQSMTPQEAIDYLKEQAKIVFSD